MKKLLIFFALLLSGCSSTVTPVVERVAVPTASVDFGMSPLMHVADTTITVAQSSSDSIIRLDLSDQNFMCVAYHRIADTLRQKDSAWLHLRFIPHQVGNVSASLSLRSRSATAAHSDTLASITIRGTGTPFENRIGDSYVFQNDSTGALDSVWVAKLPLVFMTSDSLAYYSFLDRTLQSIRDRDSVWSCEFFGAGYAGNTIAEQFQVRTLFGFSDGSERVDSSGAGSRASRSATSNRVPTAGVDTVDGRPFIIDRLVAQATDFFRAHLVEYDGFEQIQANYSPDLGFFTQISDSVHTLFQGPNQRLDKKQHLHLLHYHLWR